MAPLACPSGTQLVTAHTLGTERIHQVLDKWTEPSMWQEIWV